MDQLSTSDLFICIYAYMYILCKIFSALESPLSTTRSLSLTVAKTPPDQARVSHKACYEIVCLYRTWGGCSTRP